MKQLLLIFLSLLFVQDKPQDVVIIEQVAEELGCIGKIGIYRTESSYSELHNYSKYFELRLNCPNLFEIFDSISVRKAYAYRTYLKLTEGDKTEYEAIQVFFTDDLKSEIDTSSFFSMAYLETIYQSEMLVREYMKALKEKNVEYLKKAFDSEDFGYTETEIDSLNNSFLEITKGKFDESRLINWAFVEQDSTIYKPLVFVTGSESNYNIKFQFVLHDSIRTEKNIVTINF